MKKIIITFIVVSFFIILSFNNNIKHAVLADTLPTFTNSVHQLTGDLNLSGNNAGTGSGLVFVDGNLNFTGNYCYRGDGSTDCSSSIPPSPLIGVVFVVSKDVIIAPEVTRIDAVIISYGKIFTAGALCSQLTPVLSSQLIINGSLISLDQNNKIEFCRTLSDNSLPAEKIVQQPKYLVILRHLMSDTYQKWSEIP